MSEKTHAQHLERKAILYVRQSSPGSMPANNSFRLDKYQRLLPSKPETPLYHPEQSVGG